MSRFMHQRHHPGGFPIGTDCEPLTRELDCLDPLADDSVFMSRRSIALRGPHGMSVGTPSVGVNPPQPAPTRAPQQNQRLSPVEFANLFRNVRVEYYDPRSGMADSVTIDVHIYSNNGIDDRRGNMAEKSRLISALRRELRRAGGLGLIGVERGHKVQIAHCFFGKGNPEEFKVTLQYALRYNRATPLNLQNYCDRNAKLGVDCSGFVNTYFERIGTISRHRHINEYERGTLRSSPDEIRALDVLVWQNTTMRHIAVVDHVLEGTNPLKMVVVESSGSKGGLAVSEYTVQGVSNQVFRVNRGAGSTGTSTVKIAEVSSSG